MLAHARSAFLLAALAVLGCGEKNDDDAPAARSQRSGRDSAPAVTVVDETPLDTPGLGGLHGTVLFAGKAPERFLLGAGKSTECSHHPDVDQRSNEIVVNDGKLEGAFVTLSGVDASKVPPAPATPVRLEQKGCMYVPRVLGVRVGQPLLVTNDDPTTHNVHTRAKRNPELNRNMGASQPPLEFRFEHVERPVSFACDIHPWMGAAVFVEVHPWFTVTDAAGAFHIEGIPPGTYEVSVLHEKLATVAATVTVQAGKSTGLSATLR